MPNYPSANPAQFIQGAPVLQVPDVPTTVLYYKNVLGFVSDFGDESYAVVWRDNSAIHFMKGDETPRGVRLFHWVRDVDSFYSEILKRGAQITVEPADRPYGVRDFSVRDPNGELSLARTSRPNQPLKPIARNALRLNGGVGPVA